MKIRINSINNIIYATLLIPYLEPLLFKEEPYEGIDTVFTILKIVGLVVIILFFLKYNLHRQKLSTCSVLIILLELVILFSTVINNGDFVKYLGPAVSVISLTLLTEVFFKKIKIDFLRISRNILAILMFFNVVLQIIYPNGILPEINFLGIDNRLVFYYIPLIFFAVLYDFYTIEKMSFFTYLITAISLWSTIKLWAVGGFLGLIVMTFSILFAEKIQIFKKITMKQLISFDIIINIAVVFLQIQKYFENLIVNILQKDLTLTGRTYLWDWAIVSIKKYPILGFGIQSNSYMMHLYHWVVHPHNMFLNYLTTSGIIGMLIYLLILFKTASSTKKIEKSKIITFSNFTVFVILFLSVADTLDSAVFYMIYMVINLLGVVMQGDY